jgi:hypothetical protein
VSIVNSQIYSNTITDNYVCNRLQNFPSPQWETHVLLVVCRAAVSMSGLAQCPSHRAPSVGTQLQMCARSCSKFHIAPMGKLLTCLPRLTLAQLRTLRSTIQMVRATETLKSSHRPNGRLTFCSLFAGRWCPCLGWLSVNRELPDLLQHSTHCAPSSSKVPIAPMGNWLTCLPRLSLAQLRLTLRPTTVCTCRRDLQCFPSPDGRLTFCSLFAGWWYSCLWRLGVNRELPDLLQHS